MRGGTAALVRVDVSPPVHGPEPQRTTSLKTFSRKFARVVDADLAHARELSMEAGRVLRSWGLSETRVQGWELAVAEMATNVCRHAYGTDGGSMRLEIAWGDDGLEISLSDSGRAFDPSIVPVPGEPEAADPTTWPEGGMGLMLIRSACDRLDYTRSDDGNVLAMRVDEPTA